MPYEIIWEPRGVYRRFYGNTTDVEVTESTVMIVASSHFDKLRYAILDFLEVEGVTVFNASFIEETSAADSAAALSNPNIKVAIVTTSDEIRELAEAYKAQARSPFPTEIFSSLGDARSWVAISIPSKHRFQRIE